MQILFLIPCNQRPPVLSSDNWMLSTQRPENILISDSEYLKRYKAGELQGMRIDPEVIKAEERLAKQALNTKQIDILDSKKRIDSDLKLGSNLLQKGMFVYIFKQQRL